MILAAGALVVGLVAGAAIGWKVEQSRVKSDVKELREQLSAPGGENARPAGRVSAVEQDSVTIVGADGKKATVETAGASVARTEEGTAADITPGARVMVRPGTDGNEILVLPAGSRFGQNVTAVDGGSLTIVNNKGTTVTIETTGNSVVYRPIDASASAITKGATIFITGTRAADGTVEAGEILVIPQNSAFEISPPGAGN